MMKLRWTRDEYVKLFLPKGALKVADKSSDAVAYVYAGQPTGRLPCRRALRRRVLRRPVEAGVALSLPQ